ncbi:hypothetical protein BJY01DRAFT_257811 [Aspergillus pseudoustus]|uniref:Uncharacterized protein n=1 Tax=Aspergillus pseudoustus TaxID=1810923 RepID=A0ABR4JGI3_9EURO
MARPIPLVEYNHDVYHSVANPSLHDALADFHALNAMHYINTSIRDCFLRHGVEKSFTACINHRHFDLSPSERNVEEPDGRAVATTESDNITPCSWLFHAGKLYPYEFKRAGNDDGEAAGEGVMEPPAAFVGELGAILVETGLCDVIGLQAYSEGVVGMESTDREKRVSTTRSYPEGAEELKSTRNSVVASFAFF